MLCYIQADIKGALEPKKLPLASLQQRSEAFAAWYSRTIMVEPLLQLQHLKLCRRLACSRVSLEHMLCRYALRAKTALDTQNSRAADCAVLANQGLAKPCKVAIDKRLLLC